MSLGVRDENKYTVIFVGHSDTIVFSLRKVLTLGLSPRLQHSKGPILHKKKRKIKEKGLSSGC
jgi:hypothetical protein